MPKNTSPSPSGLPRVQLNLRIDPEIKAWLESHEININPALLLEEAAAKLKRERSAGKGFGKGFGKGKK